LAKSIPTVVIFIVDAPIQLSGNPTFPLWHIDAVEGGGVHPIAFCVSLFIVAAKMPAAKMTTLFA
jgi:hypothetical protein